MRTIFTRIATALVVALFGSRAFGAANGITTSQIKTDVPGAVTVGASAAEGTSLAAARADHVHSTSGIPAAGACAAGQYESADVSGAGPTCAQVQTSQLGGTVTNAQLASSYSGVGACSAGQAATTLSANAAPTCSSYYGAVKEEGGASLTGRNVLNFVGPAVTATDNAGAVRTDVTVVASGVGTCGANTWASTLADGAAPTCTQPGFSNLSGTASDGQLANAYSGVGTCASGQWASALTRNGAPTCTAIDYAQLTNRIRTNNYTLDFGATEGTEATTTALVSWVASTSVLVCDPTMQATTDRADGDEDANIDQVQCATSNIVAATSFVITCSAPEGTTGKYLVACYGL